MKALPAAGALVYSTDSGRMCPGCRQPSAQCICRKNQPRPAGDGVVRVSRSTRSGKGVTLVTGLPLEAAPLTALAKQLRTACGSGGTVKDGVIEVQGDQVERVLALLLDQGFKAQRAGG